MMMAALPGLHAPQRLTEQADAHSRQPVHRSGLV
jgi:hypothetical protein